MSSAFPLSFGRTQALLDQLLEVEYSCVEDFVYSREAMATIRSHVQDPRALDGCLPFLTSVAEGEAPHPASMMGHGPVQETVPITCSGRQRDVSAGRFGRRHGRGWVLVL